MIGRTGCIVLAGLIFCALAVGDAVAQSDRSYISYRQKIMRSIAANMGAISDVFKYKLPFAGNIQSHAEAINSNAKMIFEAFERPVAAGRTDAMPDIWTDWAKFRVRAQALQVQSAELVRIASTGDMRRIMSQVKAVGKSCRDCHKLFRKPEEQRFRR